ncbi:hypothetical protein D7B12_18205 [Salmonella enterica]|nr:hypothetical protein [Salmonella enterica]
MIEARVPCNGCTACCKGDAISIHPELGDVAADYETVPHFIPELAAKGIVMLAHTPKKECVYLSPAGCKIHGKAPALCREFDCRKFVKHLGYTRSRKLARQGAIDMAVIRAGQSRMASLNPEEKSNAVLKRNHNG